jgi:Putative Flp pilus-assembly TadE/G-like
MKTIFGRPGGQVVVLYAGVAAVLIGALALCADVSVMYVNWQRAQKVADAAVIAGANYLKSYAASTGYVFAGPAGTGCSGQPDDASKAACTYAVDNGLDASTLTITDTDTSIHVVAQQTGLPFFFAKAIGMGTYSVAASASAKSGGPVETVNQGLFPVGLQCATGCSNLSTLGGEPVTFGTKFVDTVINASGNWEWLSLTQNGASSLGSVIANGAPGSYTIGDTISTAPGNKGNSGPVKKAVSDRLNSCPALTTDPCADGGNPNDIPAGDPCLVVVPAVDFKGCTGNCNMAIEGFALVYLESTTTNSSLSGCFVNGIAPTSVSSSGATQLGATTPPTMSQ